MNQEHLGPPQEVGTVDVDVQVHGGVIYLQMSKEVAWVRLTPEQAQRVAELLLEASRVKI